MTRMRRTAGQMNSHLAAPSDRHTPRTWTAPRVARSRRADPGRIGSGDFRSNGLSLDAKAGDVRSELLVLARVVGDLVPAVDDGLLGTRGVELPREVLRDRGVEDVLLIALRQRDAQVKDHVLVGEAGL